MKTRKIISFITAFVLALTLTACGSGNGSSDAPEADNTVSRSEDGLWNKTFEGVTLKRILWYEPSKSEEELKKKFEKRTGATIVDEVVDYQNYNTKIASSIAANDPYDIGYIYGAFFRPRL